ncbi:MAG: hypothetical protein V4730_07760 [Pseudomonadota bacterium]
MSKLFAFAASDALQQDFQAVIAAYADGNIPQSPQSARIVQLAQRYADEIVDALLLNLLNGAEAGSAAPKALETVASLIKGTVHTLIKQVLSKLDNKELQPVAAYVSTRRTILPSLAAGDKSGERDYISFDLSDADFARFDAVWSGNATGQIDKAALNETMLRFSTLAIAAFYEDSAKALKLGFIARNLFNVGHSAIGKGSQVAINRLIPALREKETRDFAAYFHGMLRET